MNMSSIKKNMYNKVAIANKRLDRLEQAGLTSSPAYQSWFNNYAGKRFSAKGDDWNLLQHELANVERFLGMKTSTVLGFKNVLTDTISRLGLSLSVGEGDSAVSIQLALANYYEIVNKVYQILKLESKPGFADAMEYEVIWNSVSQYFEGGSGVLTASDLSNLPSADLEVVAYKIARDIIGNSSSLNKDYQNLTGSEGWFTL